MGSQARNLRMIGWTRFLITLRLKTITVTVTITRVLLPGRLHMIVLIWLPVSRHLLNSASLILGDSAAFPFMWNKKTTFKGLRKIGFCESNDLLLWVLPYRPTDSLAKISACDLLEIILVNSGVSVSWLCFFSIFLSIIHLPTLLWVSSNFPNYKTIWIKTVLTCIAFTIGAVILCKHWSIWIDGIQRNLHRYSHWLLPHDCMNKPLLQAEAPKLLNNILLSQTMYILR